jgi:hypothetical protein
MLTYLVAVTSADATRAGDLSLGGDRSQLQPGNKALAIQAAV